MIVSHFWLALCLSHLQLVDAFREYGAAQHSQRVTRGNTGPTLHGAESVWFSRGSLPFMFKVCYEASAAAWRRDCCCTFASYLHGLLYPITPLKGPL